MRDSADARKVLSLLTGYDIAPDDIQLAQMKVLALSEPSDLLGRDLPAKLNNPHLIVPIGSEHE